MDSYIGEIRLVGFHYAPVNWAICNGAVLNIVEYQALFSLISTTYGGNGSTTFCLPNLISRLPMGQGQAPSMTARTLGQQVGTETVTVTTAQMPVHSHQLFASNVPATGLNPANESLAQAAMYYVPPDPNNPPADAPMASGSVASAGGNQAHENRMPSLGLTYIICLNGIYPAQP